MADPMPDSKPGRKPARARAPKRAPEPAPGPARSAAAGVIDVLVVGAGPSGLAAAIWSRRQAIAAERDLTVVVIDKAPSAGNHNLSGAAFEPACLDELVPGWREIRHPFTETMVPVEEDDLYFLRPRSAHRIPDVVVPRRMRHLGDVTISASRLVQFLARQAEALGVEIYHGHSARSLIVEDGVVRGVRLDELGMAQDGRPKVNHVAPEEIRVPITILADGSRGVLSTQLAERFGGGTNPQVYSLGIKAVVQFHGKPPFGSNRVLHTLGYPVPGRAFGGGFVYSAGERQVAVGLILGLDWQQGDVNPQREFETFRAHPFIARLLEGGVTIATGAKTIPEGGLASLPRLAVPGAMLVGDGAGFVNTEKMKGLHYAIHSGMAAADTALAALATKDPANAISLEGYRWRLEERGVMADLRHARNYRQSFRWGLVPGLPLSLAQSKLPKQLGLERDAQATTRGARLDRPDPGRLEGATFVSMTGVAHREDEPSHISIVDPAKCRACEADFANPCTTFCPGQAYRWDGSAIVVSPSNCLHCMTCSIKCPSANIRWVPPEGGEGPRYRQM